MNIQWSYYLERNLKYAQFLLVIQHLQIFLENDLKVCKTVPKILKMEDLCLSQTQYS